MNLKLGVNTGFAINRFMEPESWGRVVDEMGVRSVQLTASVINPFWDESYLKDLEHRIFAAKDKYNFSIDSIFTDAYTRVNHFTHPDEDARKMWYNWFCRFFEIGARLGAKSGGSHFGILTVDSYNDEHKREALTEQGVKNWQKLAKFAKELGYEHVIFEPMSVPREFGYTVAKTKELLNRVNANSAIPFRVCLDVGHAPHPNERDCYPWIEALAGVSPVIHLQQTEFNRSNHWAFTDDFNQKGYITAERVLGSMEKAGCKDALMILELSHREHWDTDGNVIAEHKSSVEYWRKYIKD